MAQKALSFDGTDDYVTVPDKACLDIADNMTVEFWLKFPDAGESGVVITKTYTNWELYFAYDTDVSWFGIYGFSTGAGGYCFYRYKAPWLARDTWYYIVATFSGTTITVYRNGSVWAVESQVNSFDEGLKPNADDLVIGARADLSQDIKAIIDEIRISDKVRSQAEITAIWNGGVGVQMEVDDDTVALWHMNEGANGTIFDETVNDNDGTITGASWVDGYSFLLAAVAVGAGSVAIAGTLSRNIFVSVGEGAIAIAGSLSTIKRILASVGGGSVAIAGTLGRKIKLVVGAGAIGTAGTLDRLIKVAVGSGAVTSSASLARKIALSVGSGAVSIAGALGRKVKLAVGSGAVPMAGTLIVSFVGRVLKIVAITSQYRALKIITAQYGLIKTVTAQYRQLKTTISQYRIVKAITAQYRKVKSFIGG